MTNRTLARQIGCSEAMASRLRAGKRLPSTELINRIHKQYRIPLKALVDAKLAGPEEFGRLIRARVFKEGIAA